MSRIYNIAHGQVYIVGRGWIPYKDYFNSNNELNSLIFYSPRYIDIPSGVESTEDFSPERWKTLGLKSHNPELRLFIKGKGTKRVAKAIIPCGEWYGSRKDIQAYIQKTYWGYIDAGYELTW